MGAGAWGTALAIHFSQHQHQVYLWTHRSEHSQYMQQQRNNSRYLPGFSFDLAIQVGDVLPETTDLVIIATPVSALRESVQRLENAKLGDVPILIACKGFEQKTGLLPHQVAKQILPDNHCIGLLSGPSFAQELASQLPCAVTISSDNTQWSTHLCRQLNTTVLRLYDNPDMIGVAVGGALKNVLAIATGIADGLNCGMNARAALMTRGLAEIARLSTALGGHEVTVMGLSGMGDLVLTCTGSLSRNRQVGLLLAKNKPLEQILVELGHVAEGVYTVDSAMQLAQQLNIDMPITYVVYQLLHGYATADTIVEYLMGRQPKTE